MPRLACSRALLLAASLALPSAARAQAAPTTTATTPTNAAPSSSAPAADPRDAEARSLFEQGVTALADERYADAYSAFSRSYEIRRVASVALNLGIALRALGRVTEARQRFNEFLEMASQPQHERHDREVGAYIADVSRRIARLHVAALEPESARILVDGRRVTRDANDDIAVDPGEHQIEAQLQGFTGAPQRITLESGGRAEVRLRLTEVRPDPRVTLGPSGGNSAQTGGGRPSAPPPITSSPWFWVGVGLGAAAVIATTTAVVLSTREQALPGLFCFRTDGSRCATGAQ